MLAYIRQMLKSQYRYIKSNVERSYPVRLTDKLGYIEEENVNIYEGWTSRTSFQLA
jgi:hypothetical protein